MPVQQGNLLVRLRALLPSLVPSKARVARVLLGDPAAASELTIGQLAAAAHTSQTTVHRLCHDLGVDGYRDLRIAVAREQGRESGHDDGELGSDISRQDTLDQIIAKIIHADSRAIIETAGLIDRAQLGAVVGAIAAARRVDVFGVGASAFIAMDLAQKLHRIGVTCFSWGDEHTALTAVALLGPGDVAIGISHTGATRDTIETVGLARRVGATTVAVTAAPRSRLATVADYCLLAASRETTFRSGAMASRIAALSLIDVVFVAVAQQRFDRTVAALDATRRAVAIRRVHTGARSDS